MQQTIDNLYEIIISNMPLFVLLIILIDRLKRISRVNTYTASLMYFFGTFFHELSHYVIALITNAKPVSFSLFPSKNKDNTIVLGEVMCANLRWYNSFLVGISPLLLLILVFIVDQYFFIYFQPSLISLAFYLFLIINLIDSAIPSNQDFKVAFSSTVGNLIYLSFFSILLMRYF